MTISFPRTDIMSSVHYTDGRLRLQEAQEYSRTQGGQTYGKSLGSPLWMGKWATAELPNRDALAFENKLNTLEGVINGFVGRDLRARFPRSAPGGTLDDSGVTILAVGADNRSLSLTGLPVGAELSPGDYLTFVYGASSAVALHQVSEAAVADGSGNTPVFAVTPHFRVGVMATLAVVLNNPYGIFRLEPDSVDARPAGALHTVISFSATQFLG